MKVVIIGGGPAGILAAISASEQNDDVYILEKNNRLGKKLLITGKGRCNITSSLPIDEFINNIPGNGRFLYSAFQNFSNEDMIPCTSILSGKLVLVGAKTNDVYRWDDIGDIQEVAYNDLISEVRRKTSFIFAPWFIILAKESQNIFLNFHNPFFAHRAALQIDAKFDT